MHPRYFKDRIYTVASAKRMFSGRTRERFQRWLDHEWSLRFATLTEAIDFADKAARGLIEPLHSADALKLSQIERLDEEYVALCAQVESRYGGADPKTGQMYLADPAPTIPRTLDERVARATKLRDDMRARVERLRAEPRREALEREQPLESLPHWMRKERAPG
jgi:hypothetical protein